MIRRFLWFPLCVGAIAVSCRGGQLLEPPTFNYAELTDRFFTTHPAGHFPLTVQRGSNLHPTVTAKGHLFYTSDVSGSGDIWMRDLKNTINLPVVQHPAQQYHPAVHPSGNLLAFVSDDLDSAGDIRLLEIKPDAIVRLALQGVTNQNFWADTVNLSELLREAAAKLPAECRGEAAEDDPVFLPTSQTLIYASDRCSPGKMNLWMVKLDGTELAAPPVRLTTEGGRMASPNAFGTRIAFIAYREKNSGGEIYIREADGRERRVPHPSNGYRTFSPSLSPDGLTLYYAALRTDTNGDGSINLSDEAVIYKIPADATGPEAERVLLDGTHVQGVQVGIWGGGFLMYSANVAGSINIHYLKPDGIIPRKSTADEQFRFAREYADAPPRRHFLALDSVRTYFAGFAEAAVYEALVVVEKWKRLSRTRVPDDLSAAFQADLKAVTKQNRYADLLFALETLKSQGRPVSGRIREFLGNLKDSPEDRLFRAAALEDLAAALVREGRPADALKAVKEINERFPQYHRIVHTRKLEGLLEMRSTESVPASLSSLLGGPLPIDVRDEIQNQIVIFFSSSLAPELAMRVVMSEMKRTDLHPEAAAALRLARARLSFEARQYANAIADARTMLGSTNRESPLFVRAWQLISFCQERLGNPQEAHLARLEYGGAFRPGSGVDVTLKEYREIIEENERAVDLYLGTARSVSRHIDDAVGDKIVISPVARRTVPLGGLERDVLAAFCAQGSPAARIFAGLGPANNQTYTAFCAKNLVFFTDKVKEPLPLDDAEAAADLLYIASYTNVNALNILFFYMKKVNLFEDLHAEKSVYFHRLKVDLAMERNRRRLDADKRRFALPGAANIKEIITSQDPFDSRAFTELEYGYKISSEPARQVGDLSLLYGYAYTLIQKSVERDRFYDDLQRAGTLIPAEVFAEKKDATLRDMKNAEYQLRYILLTDPTSADPYLLLGWLYQYLDERKGTQIAREPGILEKAFNFFTGTRPAIPTEGRQFASLYRNYFPDQLYETNVELYQLALHFRSGAGDDAVGRAHLHLNLANNYFNLLNFKRAVEHYAEVSRIEEKAGREIFDSYIQKALFHFNSGRALYYEGRPQEAAAQFEKARRLYYDKEKKPLEEAMSLVRFKGGADGKHVKDLEERLGAVRAKLALIASLQGLVRYEEGRLQEAAYLFQEAERELATIKLKTQTDATENRANILNFLAMVHQSAHEWKKSDERALEAAELAKAAGLSRNDRRFQPQTLGGRSLGCLLNYGEDFSVLGDGRNPYGFSPLRQYELALGIRLETLILQGEYEKAYALLDERMVVFSKKDGDVNLGKIGAVTAGGQKGYALYQSGRFAEASAEYRKTAEAARDNDLLPQFLLHFKNHFHAQFADIEASRTKDRTRTLNELEAGLTSIEKFREEYREKALARFVREKTTEDPKFKFNEERDNPALMRIIDSDLSDFVNIEATLLIYRARLGDSEATTAPAVDGAAKDYARAIERLTISTASYAKSGNLFKELRARLNRARIYLESGRLLHARAEYEALSEKTYEFDLAWAELEARLGWMETEQAMGRFRGTADAGRIRENAVRITEILQKENGTAEASLSRDRLIEKTAAYWAQAGNPDLALSLLERNWAARMETAFLRFPIPFEKANFRASHERIRDLTSALRQLEDEMARARVARQKLDKLQESEARIRSEREAEIRNFIGLAPHLKSFLRPPPLRPAVQPGQALIRFFVEGGNLYAWRFLPGGVAAFYKEDLSDGTAALSRIFAASLPERGLHDLFLIPDAGSWRLPIEDVLRKIRPALPAPVFVTRLDDALIGFADGTTLVPDQIRLFNVSRVKNIAESDAATADVIMFPMPVIPDLFFAGNQAWNAREWISSPRSASLALIDAPDPEFETAALLYELLRASGSSSAVFVSSPESQNAVLTEAGKSRLGGLGMRVFGNSGFDAAKIVPSLRSTHITYREKGRTAMENGSMEESVRFLRIADSTGRLLPDADEFSFDGRLLLARALIIRSKGREGREVLDKIIADASAPGRREQAYRAAVDAYVAIGDTLRAEKTLTDFASAFPAKKGELAREADLVRFISRLRRSRYAAAGETRNFDQDFQQAFPLLAQTDDAAILNDLLRHGLHKEAETLHRILSLRPRTRDHLPFPVYEVQADGALIAGRPIPTGATAESSTAGRLLSASAGGDWNAYETISDNLRPEENPALYSIKKKLYSVWRSYARHESFVGIEQGETGSVALLSVLERSMLYRALIGTAAKDAENSNARALEALIRVEIQTWCTERAAEMALGAAHLYLELDDPGLAQTFFALYVQAEAGSIPSFERNLKAARAGMALWSFGHGKDFQEALPGWKKILTASGLERSVQLFEASQSGNGDAGTAKLVATLPPLRAADFLKDASYVAAAWKHRSMEKEDFHAALNAAFFEQEIRDTSALLSRGRGLPAGWKMPAYTDIARAIFGRMDPRQRFVGLIESQSRAVRLYFKQGVLSASELEETPQAMRARLADALGRSRTGTLELDEFLRLSRDYRMIFGLGESRITYVWLPGIHALAPLLPERNDRFYQILNPAAFSENAPVKSGQEFNLEFDIFAVGTRTRDLYADEAPIDVQWFERLDTMETLSLGKRSANPASVRHFFTGLPPLDRRGLDPLEALLRIKSTSAWFFSGNMLGQSTVTESADYSVLLHFLGLRMAGPGVMTMRMAGAGHPQFVRNYYSRSLPIASIDRRFVEAYRALRNATSAAHELYGYRLVTASPLLEN